MSVKCDLDVREVPGVFPLTQTVDAPPGCGESTPCAIILATLNERDNLPILLSEIHAALSSVPEIVIIDDGSTDGTREFAKSFAANHSNVKLVLNDSPQTIARAHYQGIRTSTADLLVFMDSDLQHPPQSIPAILQGLNSGFDVVVGSRYCHGGHTGERSLFRGLVSRTAGLLARMTLRCLRKLSDPTSGFFGVRRDVIVDEVVSPPGYYTLMFLLARMKRPRVEEVPYVFRERGSGRSKVMRGVTFVHVYLSQLMAARRLEDARGDRGPSNSGQPADRTDRLRHLGTHTRDGVSPGSFPPSGRGADASGLRPQE
jgi:dolichol-phosphate mannosyltransferase